MPLVPSPNTGYPDGQRIANYDSGLLALMANVAGPGPYVSTIINMQHYAACAGNLACTVNPCVCTLAWYDDIALTILAGQKILPLSPLIQPGNGGMLLPNLGPFLQITFTNIGGLNFTGEAIIFGSNRVSPIPFIPENGMLINQQNVAITANATTILYPSDYYAGPLHVWWNMNQTSQVTLQALDTGGSWDDIDQLPVQPASTSNTMRTLTPPGAWRMLIGNTAAVAGAFFLVATPTITGAG